MAVPRPVLLALVGVVLIAAAFIATRGARGGGDEVGAPAPAARAGSAEAAKPRPAGDRPEAAPAAKRQTAPATKAKPGASAATAPSTAGLPPRVARALAQRKTIVLFFFQRGADDTATASAVAALPRRGVAVFRDALGDVADYRLLTEETGVSQAPAVVVVGRDGRPRLVEGYVDSATLAQMVVDARR